MLSIGAPLWFAWLATKQIGQRFRLAEDYEFKAAVSKAYEGYRREAIILDDELSHRLFSNALTRLEEPPLRFVEVKSPSSPIMEMLCRNKPSGSNDRKENSLPEPTKPKKRQQKSTEQDQEMAGSEVD